MTVFEISIDTYKESPESYDLVDIRRADEYHKGHISAIRHVPLETMFVDFLEATSAAGSQDKVYLFVCARGQRSLHAALLAHDMGVRGVSLKGGMLAWAHAGLGVVVEV